MGDWFLGWASGLFAAFVMWLFGQGLWWMCRLGSRVEILEGRVKRLEEKPSSAPSSERPH